jgi:hypothetical protein
MSPRELVKSILRTRVLVVHPMISGYDEPSAKKKSYLVLGSDSDIRGFTQLVDLEWPICHHVYLI